MGDTAMQLKQSFQLKLQKILTSSEKFCMKWGFLDWKVSIQLLLFVKKNNLSTWVFRLDIIEIIKATAKYNNDYFALSVAYE